MTRLFAWVERNAVLLLWLALGLWGLIFSTAAIYKLHAFWMGFDLGTHEQVLWNTIHGRIAASSPSRGTSSYFGVDIIITELLLAPLYGLWQRPETLLVIQAMLVPLGAVPLYLLAVQRLESRWAGLVAAGLYLLALPVQYATLYEFQIRVVGTVAFLWAFWALEQRHMRRFWLFAALALGSRAEAGFALAFIGIYAAIHRCGWRWSLPPIIVGLGWVALTNALLIPAARTDHISLYAFLYGWLGDTPAQMLTTLLTRPGYVAQHVLTAGKLEYLLQLCAPLLFVFVLRLDIAMIALPALALNLLSPDRIHWSIRYHYQAFVLPWLLLATLYAIADLRRRPRTRRWWPAALTLVLAATLTSNLLWRSPLQTLISRQRDADRIAALHAALALLPPDAPVTVSSQFGPFVARRTGLYYFPGNIVYPRQYIERGEWILVDRTEVPADCMARLDVLVAHPQWRVEYERGDLILLHNQRPDQPTRLLDALPRCAVEPEGTP